jgi:hypothetical protein
MSLAELYALIETNITRVGANRVTAAEIKEAIKEVVNYFAGNSTDLFIQWNATTTFNATGTGIIKYCQYPDTNGKIRIWESRVNGNINNQPPSNPLTSINTFWVEISPSSGSALPEWAPGVYGAGLQIVFYNHSIEGDGLYKLTEPTRPFTSSNIETEIVASKWSKIQGQSIGRYTVVTTSPTITCNWFNRQDAVFVGSAAIVANKTVVFTNFSVAQNGTIFFTIGAGSPFNIIFPNNFIFEGDNAAWDNATKTLALWQGSHKIKFESDGTNYLAELISY